MPSLESLVTNYGYLAIFIGTFLEGETILILGGIAASQGFLELHLVMLAAFTGSYAGDQLAFGIGRKFGPKILARKPSWQKKADFLLSKSPTALNIWMVIFRFFYGLRNPTPWVLGYGGIAFFRFLALNGIGALVWAIAGALAGYWVGALIIPYIEKAHGWTLVLVGIALAVIITSFFLYKRYRRKKTELNVLAVPATPAETPPKN